MHSGKRNCGFYSEILPKSGVTLIELMIAVLLLSLLFGSAYGVMRYSRLETAKGFWIQQAITQLRNGTRAITQQLKRTSYPSTIIDESDKAAKVITFKEMRTYHHTGRLDTIETNESTDFDLHAMVTDGAVISPSFKEQSILYFPVCTPEKEDSSGTTSGNITWYELVLRPEKTFKYNGLGRLHFVQRSDTYVTTGDERAFGLTGKKFDRQDPVTGDKLLINDVRGIEVQYFEVEELRGITYKENGEQVLEKNKKVLLSLTVTCSHPKDGKIWLSDRCSVIINVRLVELPMIALIEIVSTGSSGKAVVSEGGTEKTVGVGDMLGGYKVNDIVEEALVLIIPGSDTEYYLPLKED